MMLAGGHSLFSTSLQGVNGKVDVWDFAAKSWTSRSDLPGGRVGTCMSAINDTHVIVAGISVAKPSAQANAF